MLEHLDGDRRTLAQPLSARDLAHLHAIRQGIEGDDLATFLNIFDRTRDAELRGQDTYKMWRAMLDDSDGALATAAYLEGIASVRTRVAR